MMSELGDNLKKKVEAVANNINQFFSFVNSKLKNYTALSLGEKIAYPSVGLGLLFILISIVLFIV